eukprot:COSAG01_NODE_5321_length_4335_cov_3.928234_3_plen_150_part_00
MALAAVVAYIILHIIIALHALAQCPDVFELDGKIVVIASFSNRSQGVFTHCYQWYRIGEMSGDDLKFIPDRKSGPPDRLDYGAVGVSTIYAGKTGTSARPPFTRRVLVSFTGYGNRYLTNCGFDGEQKVTYLLLSLLLLRPACLCMDPT